MYVKVLPLFSSGRPPLSHPGGSAAGEMRHCLPGATPGGGSAEARRKHLLCRGGALGEGWLAAARRRRATGGAPPVVAVEAHPCWPAGQ